MKKLLSVFYIPALLASTCGIAYVLTIKLQMKTAYIPNIIFMFMLLGLIEAIRGIHHQSSSVDWKRDIFFTILNPLVMPIFWYLMFYPFFHMKLDPMGMISKMGLLSQTFLVFFVGEFFRYIAHRAQHEIPWLWKFHAVHHCMPKLYSYNQYLSHPLDYFIRNSITFTPVIMMNFDPMAIVMARSITVAISMNAHVDTGIKYGLWNYLFPTFELHSWHHSIHPHEANNNYGIATSVFDLLLGSFFWPKDKKVEKFGVESVDYYYDIKRMQVEPFGRSN